jgi:hypothetical protein
MFPDTICGKLGNIFTVFKTNLITLVKHYEKVLIMTKGSPIYTFWIAATIKLLQNIIKYVVVLLMFFGIQKGQTS